MAGLRIQTILACALQAGLWLAPAEAAADRFRLVVSGSTFVDFEGDCGLVDQRGFESRARLIGSVPQSYAITAEAVVCEIRNADRSGRLTVRLEQNGVVLARGSTRASLGEVEVRSAGAWGPARATVKVLPLLPRGVRPRQQFGLLPNSPIVPPLSGQIVPPLR